MGSFSTKAIIICAGEGTRWGNYLGVPKHLIIIEGETLVHRTARLLKESGVHQIFVVTKRSDERYDTPYSTQAVVGLNYEKHADADKFLSSKHLWNNAGRTLVVYGDCYFTETAIRQIVFYDKTEWTLFCRPQGSTITGAKYGECFAQSFYPEDIKEHEKKLHYIADLKHRGIISRCGGWEHYRAMVGKQGKEVRHPHVMTTNYFTIDDFTEDFDTPEDYLAWVKHYANRVQTT